MRYRHRLGLALLIVESPWIPIVHGMEYTVVYILQFIAMMLFLID